MSPYRMLAELPMVSDPEPPRVPLFSRVAIVAALLVLSVTGCAWWDAHGKTVETVALDAASIACIEASAFTDAPAVVDACKIDKTLTPLVEQLIAQKMAAKKAGFSWKQPGSDAGAEAGQ
jgi:hypothetical protein